MHPDDFLVLAVEAGITIAGFTGIVVVLGRRQLGNWTTAERLQLRGLLFASIFPVAISGLALVLLTAEVFPVLIWRIASLAILVILAIAIPSAIRQARSQPREHANRAERRIIFASLSAISLLLAANLVWLGAFWPLALTLYFQIGMALFNFIQLLWRAIFTEPG